MASLLNAKSPQPTGVDPYATKDIGGSAARLAGMQRALAGGRRKRKPTKGGAAPGALPNGGTVVAQYPGDNPANAVLVKMAALGGQAEANRTFAGGKQSGGRRNKGRKTRKTHKKRRQYAKKTRRRYKH